MTEAESKEEWAQHAKALPDHERAQIVRAADVLLQHTLAISDALESELYVLLDFLGGSQKGATR